MKKYPIFILCVYIFFSIICNADQNWLPVASSGSTTVKSAIGKTHALVKITNHEVEIGEAGSPRPEKILSSCTYSRHPCSVVDYLEIAVDGKPLFIYRSVYADLADVNRVSLQQKNGQFTLTLEGGDASESYRAEILFTSKLILKRIITNSESGEVAQETRYFKQPVLDN